MQETGAHLQLNADGSYSLHAADGAVRPGHFTVDGETLVLTYNDTGRTSTYRIQGDKMYASTGRAWARQGDAPAPVPPPAAPLSLPATYVNTRAQADQLLLNANNSFSLQEAGETYHGTFAVNGNALELNISESNTKTTATLQGNNLTDSSGQTWVLRKPSAGPPTGAAELRNEDVIRKWPKLVSTMRLSSRRLAVPNASLIPRPTRLSS